MSFLKRFLLWLISDEEGEKRFEIKFGISVLDLPRGGTKGIFRDGGVITRVVSAKDLADAQRKATVRLGEEIYRRQYLAEVLKVRETTDPIFIGPMHLGYFLSRLPADY